MTLQANACSAPPAGARRAGARLPLRSAARALLRSRVEQAVRTRSGLASGCTVTVFLLSPPLHR